MQCDGNNDTNLQCSSLQAGPCDNVMTGTSIYMSYKLTQTHKTHASIFLVDSTTKQQDDAQSHVKLQKYTFLKVNGIVLCSSLS